MFIYLHGFASSGNSSKSQALIKEFGAENVWSPDLPMNPSEVIAMVNDFIRSEPRDKIVFVGTSLGGFYARYFSQIWDAPCVLINPSTRPSTTLAVKLGDNTNYSTGETFEVTEDHLDQLAELEKFIASNRPSGTLIDLFLAKDDAVIPYETALANIPFHNSLTITETGGHRFDTNFPDVLEFLKKF